MPEQSAPAQQQPAVAASSNKPRLRYLHELTDKDKQRNTKESHRKLSQDKLKTKRFDEEQMKAMLEERAKIEKMMLSAARSWNLIAARVRDPRISNVLLPLIRMICRQIITSLSRGLPNYDYRPENPSDLALVNNWKAANEHVDDQTNMLAEQEDFITNFVVLGNAAYEDYLHCAYKTIREDDGKGGWSTRIVRDRAQPKIGTRSRSPWSFAYATWAGAPNGRAPKMWKDYYDWNTFVDVFGNAKNPATGEWKYQDVEFVRPGAQEAFMPDKDEVCYQQINETGVCVATIQDPQTDVMRRWANGVCIEDIALHEYCAIQKSTLSIAGNLHMFDTNLKSAQGWKASHAHILRGLDALWQAIGNLTIDNYKQANTFVYGTKGGDTTTALDPDLSYLSGMRMNGEVIVSPVGRVNLADFGALKVAIDEMCIALTGFNFKQLVGETSKTAFEFQQRLNAQSAELEQILAKLENDCLKNHGEVRLCMMFQHMTVAETEEITQDDLPNVVDLIADKRMSKDDVEFEAGEGGPIPKRRVYRERVRVRGRKIEEVYADGDQGKRTPKSFIDRGPAKGVDSYLTVADVFFHPTEWKEGKRIPGVVCRGKTMTGINQAMEFQKVSYVANYARQRIAEATKNPTNKELATTFSGPLIDDLVVQTVDIDPDRVMRGEQPAAKPGVITAEQARKNAEAMRSALSPSSNAQGTPGPSLPPTAEGVSDVDPGGFGSLGTPGPGGESNTAGVEARALGAR